MIANTPCDIVCTAFISPLEVGQVKHAKHRPYTGGYRHIRYVCIADASLDLCFGGGTAPDERLAWRAAFLINQAASDVDFDSRHFARCVHRQRCFNNWIRAALVEKPIRNQYKILEIPRETRVDLELGARPRQRSAPPIDQLLQVLLIERP